LINLIYVVSGGAIGASLRYFSSIFFKFFSPNFPLGTLFVNILGSFLIGVLISNLENNFFSENFIKYFLIIGLLGSFTTFSSFSIEAIELYNNKKLLFSIFYVIVSVFSCIIAAYAGYNINKI